MSVTHISAPQINPQAKAVQAAQQMAKPVNVMRSLTRILRGWLAVRQLSEFDAHMLADIGLSEADLYAARATPLYEDPTVRLAELSRARRCRRGGGEDAYSGQTMAYISGLGEVRR